MIMELNLWELLARISIISVVIYYCYKFLRYGKEKFFHIKKIYYFTIRNLLKLENAIYKTEPLYVITQPDEYHEYLYTGNHGGSVWGTKVWEAKIFTKKDAEQFLDDNRFGRRVEMREFFTREKESFDDFIRKMYRGF